MDRRQKRTRNAIFQATAKLLAQKRFDSITVQEIIDEADIGRSTFYAHFDTKDDLLRGFCENFLWQVSEVRFEADPGGVSAIEAMLIQVFAKGKEYKQSMAGLYAGASAELFERYLKEFYRELFRRCLPEFDPGVPEKYLLHILTDSLAQTLRWWIMEDCPYTPKEMASYYMAVMKRK